MVKRADDCLELATAMREQSALFRPGAGASLAPTNIEYQGSGLQRKYDLLKVLCRDSEAAIFTGREWIPNHDASRGATFASFVSELCDPVLVSRSLDELLDAGLLRAGDNNLAGPGEVATYARTFLPGGEFNAVSVSRLALGCRTPISPVIDYNGDQFDSLGE